MFEIPIVKPESDGYNWSNVLIIWGESFCCGRIFFLMGDNSVPGQIFPGMKVYTTTPDSFSQLIAMGQCYKQHRHYLQLAQVYFK